MAQINEYKEKERIPLGKEKYTFFKIAIVHIVLKLFCWSS